MSVIAARVYKDRIVMAADSIMVRGWSKSTTSSFSKLNEVNDMLIGGTGTTQELSLMWNFGATHKPASATEKNILEFIIEFSRWKRDLTGDGGIACDYLIAFGGHLFQTSDMFVREVLDYCAIGAGEDYSNAALYLGHSPAEAVKVACELCCFVAEPIVELSMERRD